MGKVNCAANSVEFLATCKLTVWSACNIKEGKYKLNVSSKIIPTIEKYVDHIHYLDIPLKVNYNIINKHTKIFISAGISSNLFLSSKILMQKENSSARELIKGNSEFSKINFATLVGVGLKTNFSPKWSFKFELIYRQSITTVMDAPVKKYFYSIGSNFGLFYTL